MRGETLKRLRVQRGLTLYGLQKKSGVDRSVISRIENNKTGAPLLKTLEKLAIALDVPLETLKSNLGVFERTDNLKIGKDRK